MPDTRAKDNQGWFDFPAQSSERERRSEERNEGVLDRIEDATYAVLRKHEKKPALRQTCAPGNGRDVTWPPTLALRGTPRRSQEYPLV